MMTSPVSADDPLSIMPRTLDLFNGSPVATVSPDSANSQDLMRGLSGSHCPAKVQTDSSSQDLMRGLSDAHCTVRPTDAGTNTTCCWPTQSSGTASSGTVSSGTASSSTVSSGTISSGTISSGTASSGTVSSGTASSSTVSSGTISSSTVSSGTFSSGTVTSTVHRPPYSSEPRTTWRNWAINGGAKLRSLPDPATIGDDDLRASPTHSAGSLVHDGLTALRAAFCHVSKSQTGADPGGVRGIHHHLQTAERSSSSTGRRISVGRRSNQVVCVAVGTQHSVAPAPQPAARQTSVPALASSLAVADRFGSKTTIAPGVGDSAMAIDVADIQLASSRRVSSDMASSGGASSNLASRDVVSSGGASSDAVHGPASRDVSNYQAASMGPTVLCQGSALCEEENHSKGHQGVACNGTQHQRAWLEHRPARVRAAGSVPAVM